MDEDSSSKSSDDDANVQSFLVAKSHPKAPSVTFVGETQRPRQPDQPHSTHPKIPDPKESSSWFHGLSNGDVIHNGRVLRSGPAKMGDTITPLSPHLTLKLKGLKSFIPLPVFNEEFLIRDQMAWSMDFEAWSDCMELMCVHLRDQDWGPVADRFEHHMVIVKQLRKDFGWMVALRYCRLVRQGFVRETNDNSIRQKWS